MRQHLTRTHRLSKYLWTVLGHIGSQNTNGQYPVMAVFGVFVYSGGGSILTYVDKVCVVICDQQNRVRSMFLEFLLIVEGGRTPDKRIPEGLF